MPKPDCCKGCPLEKNSEGYAVGEGPKEAKVLLLGEALGSEEAFQGRPFVGGAGRTLNYLLGHAGVHRSELYITNIVRCRPPGNRTPTEAEIKFCTTAHNLPGFFTGFNLIVPLGNTALQAVTGKEKISKWRGSVFQVNGRKYLPTYHPAAVMRQQEFIPTVLADFQKIKQESWTDEYLAPKQDYLFQPHPGHVLAMLAADKPFAFDVETNSLEAQAGSLTLIGLSNEAGTAIGIRDYYSNPLMREALQRLFSSPLLKIAHNASFDIEQLRANGFTIEGPFFDTMLAHHLVLSDVQNDLGYVASLYTRIPYWKDQMKRDLMWYNATDVDATLRCYEQLQHHLKIDGLERVFATTMSVLPALREMAQIGVKVNTREQLKWKIALERVITQREKDLLTIVGDPSFNWKSHQQLTKLLYTIMKFPKVYSKFGEGVSANEDALKELFDLTGSKLVKILLELRKTSKLASTYFAGTTNRVHSQYLLHGTATGRLSSRDPNLQNVPRGPARAIYIPEAGNVFVSADYNQIELRISAILAGEDTLLEAFTQGEDIHRKTAATIHHIALKEVTEAQRLQAKLIVYGLNYGRGARSLAQEYKMTISATEHFIAEYAFQFPKIWAWRQECVIQAKKEGYLANPFGRRRYFFGPSIVTKVYNYIPQSTAADILLESLALLHSSLLKSSRLVLTVHDSVMVECRPEDVEQVKQLLHKAMERPLPELQGHHIPIKFGVGNNWADVDA